MTCWVTCDLSSFSDYDTRRNIFGFLRELFSLSKHVQPALRSEFFAALLAKDRLLTYGKPSATYAFRDFTLTER